MEKTKYELKAEVETTFALPKTLQAETQMMPMNGALVPMYAVYGRDMEEKRVWCATFVDRDEAAAWVHASKAFGRAVRGAVIANQQEKPSEETTTLAEDETGSVVGGDAAQKPN